MRWAPSIPLSKAYWFQEGPGLRNWQFTDNGIKILNVGNILGDGTIDLSKTDRHLAHEEFHQKYGHFGIDAGDLVIASSGISFDDDGFLRTKVAFVEEAHLPLCMNTSTIRFKATDGLSDLNYLRYWLQSAEFRSQVSRLVTGSAQLNFGPSHLKAMSISLPPLPEQRRIAAILDKADALRRQRQRAIDLLDSLTQSIFLEMFVGTPEEWSTVKVRDVSVDMRTGPFGSQLLHSEFVDEGIAVLGIDNAVSNKFKWGERRFISASKYKQLKRYTVRPRDVLITIMGTCGRCAIVPDDIPTAINTKHLCCITLDQTRFLPEYLQAAFLGHPAVLGQLGIHAKGAVMPGLNMGIIGDLTLPMPPVGLQREFALRVRQAAKAAVISKQQRRAASTLFASLQSRAFADEL